jgi:hypothetical protein
MITHRLRSLHILIHDEYRFTEKLSTGLRNVRLLVRPQLVTSVVAVGFAGRARRGPGEARPCAAPRTGEFLTMYPVSGDGPESSIHRDDVYISCVSSSHLARRGSCCAWLQGKI